MALMVLWLVEVAGTFLPNRIPALSSCPIDLTSMYHSWLMDGVGDLLLASNIFEASTYETFFFLFGVK